MCTRIVDKGSPSGVKAAPRPTAKQVITVIFTLSLFEKGSVAITSAKIQAVTITEMTLEIRPNNIMKRKMKILCPSLPARARIALAKGLLK